jgi:hypothetical protein
MISSGSDPFRPPACPCWAWSGTWPKSRETGSARSWECDHARLLVAAAPSLDVSGPRGRNGPLKFSLRWLLTHMIEEYSRHNGHADLLRERLDGSTGE